ncbi:MAG: DUF3883 domain-containing protein [Bacilli bacterium]|nr:DUF3883 domain-containing protein [Bacilli bacterium]
MAKKYLRNNGENKVYSILSVGRKDNTGILFCASEYMRAYPDDEITKNLREWIFNNIKEAFQNPLLQRAIQIPDEYPFTRRIEIYKCLPFVNKYNSFRYYVTILLKLEKDKRNTPVSLYKSCKEYCNKYFKGQIDDKYFDDVIKAVEDYDLNFFSNSTSDLSFDEKKALFVGKCGEYIISNFLKRYDGRTTYVSKDCSSNFGFDVLYDDPYWDKEVLIEVKSTFKPFDEDHGIIVSKNERRIMFSTADLPKTEYVIIRTYLNEETKVTSYLILYYDKKRDIFYNYYLPNYDIEYHRKKSRKSIRYEKVLIPKNNNRIEQKEN